MEELSKFLDFLYEKGDTGYIYSPVKTKEGEWHQRFFLWPAEKQNFIDWALTSSESGNVYIAPALFNHAFSAKKENVKHSNVAWVEFDGKTTISFDGIPEPDVIVQTSTEDHLHCYWKVPASSGEIIEDVNRRLTYHLGADSSGWDCTQILRVPGTSNWKRKPSHPVKVVKFKPPIFKHKLEKFDKAPEVGKPPLIIEYADLEQPDEVLARYHLPEEIRTMVLKENAVFPGRSTFLMRAGYLLASANLQEVEIISLLYTIDSRIKKFVGRSDQLLRLAEIAALAILEVTKIMHVEGYSPSEILNNEVSLEWLIPGWLHRNGIMLVTGAPGTGKTQFCFDLAYRLTSGSSVLGKDAQPPVSICFLSLEMEIVELKYIVQHQYEEWKDDGTLYSLYDANFKAFAPDEERSFMVYERVISTFKPKVVIIDSLSELAEDDLKESEARVIMGWVRKIRKDYDCAVILIHHNRKASDGNKRPRKLSDLYGSYIFGKLSETVLSLWDTERDSILEIDQMKVRFGQKVTIRIKRSPNLTFSKQEINISVGGRSGETGRTNPLLSIVTESGSD